MIRALKPYFNPFLVTCDGYFLTMLLEDGRAAGVRWRRWPVQFAIGGDWFPESYRQYLATLLEVDLDQPRPSIRILSSMGAAELGFHVCFEMPDTARLRQLAVADGRVREALFGAVDTVPMIGHYDPRRWFVELTPTRELAGAGTFAFTDLDLAAAMPLVRYETGDCGYVLPHRHVATVLRELNYHAYIPHRTDPLMAVAGRATQYVAVAGKNVRMPFLRSLLYSDARLASCTTGQFHASVRQGKLLLRIQLRRDCKRTRVGAVARRFSTLFNRHIATEVEAVPYFEFREALGIDYDRKFQHQI
jgi:hypothetical protein